MRFKWIRLGVALAFGFFLSSLSLVYAENKYSADTGECEGDTSLTVTSLKTPVRVNDSRSVKMVGKLEIRRNAGDATKVSCHVVYHLLVSEANKPFHEVKHVEWDTEEGEIAGINLIGFSPDESKLAADFWLAAGDWVGPRPVVYDLKAHTVSYLTLEDKIQKRINSCDQLEDFIGVTDQGEAIFAVPPSEYDDSPGCGDKGVWHFNLQTGLVYRVKKISGDKWK